MKTQSAWFRILGVVVLIALLGLQTSQSPSLADYTTRSSMDLTGVYEPLSMFKGRDNVTHALVSVIPQFQTTSDSYDVYYVNISRKEARVMLNDITLTDVILEFFVNDNPDYQLRKPHILMLAPDDLTPTLQQVYLYRLDPNENASETIAGKYPFNPLDGSIIGQPADTRIETDVALSPTGLPLDQNVTLSWLRHVNVINTTDETEVTNLTLVEAFEYDPVNLVFGPNGTLTNPLPQTLFEMSGKVWGAIQLDDTGRTGGNPYLPASAFGINSDPLKGRILETGVARLVFFWNNGTINKITAWDFNTTSHQFEQAYELDVAFTYTEASWIRANGEDYFVFSKPRFSFEQTDYFPTFSLYKRNAGTNQLVELTTFYSVDVSTTVSEPWLEMRNMEAYTDGRYVYVGVSNYTIVANVKTYQERAGFLRGNLAYPNEPWLQLNDLDMEAYIVSEMPSAGTSLNVLVMYADPAQQGEFGPVGGTLYWEDLVQAPWVTQPLEVITNVVSTETTTLETFTETTTVYQNVTVNQTETVYTAAPETTAGANNKSSPVSTWAILVAIPVATLIARKRIRR